MRSFPNFTQFWCEKLVTLSSKYNKDGETMNKLFALIEVRKIAMLVFTFVFAYMAIAGLIDTQNVIVIMTMVFAYYFNKNNDTEDKTKK